MINLIKIAFRNIFRDKKRSVSLGATFSIIGFILIIVFSFTNGVKVNFKENFTQAFFGDLTIFGFDKNGQSFKRIINYNKEIEKIIKEKFKDSEILFRISSGFRVYSKGFSKMIDITGIDPEIDKKGINKITILKGSWKDFLEDESSIIISEEDANYLEVDIGDEILGVVKTYTGAYNTIFFVIKGIYKSSNLLLSTQSFGHLSYLKKGLNFPLDSSEEILIYFDKKEKRNTLNLKKEVNNILEEKGYNVIKEYLDFSKQGGNAFLKFIRDFMQSNKNGTFFFILAIDEIMSAVERFTSVLNGVALVIGFVLFLIIGVSLFINIRMTINNRMVEIGTIRTIGMKREDIVKLFILENVILGIIFTLIGYIVGGFLIFIFSYFIDLSSIRDLQLFLKGGHLFFLINLLQLIFLLLAIIFLTIIFAYIPSRYAGKIKPVEALRREF
ncbi:MAG: FtsX-like permease family protein [Spirochaetes bacterium]|nr:FtsX-like permease family protein [Spirochaetota bacterium]